MTEKLLPVDHATPATITVGSVNLLEVITKDRVLPAGYDGWAIRTVRPDLTSSRGFRYPYPGNVAVAPGPILDHRGECPIAAGDGICAALTWRGMASGGVAARTLLLVAYNSDDILGRSDEKLRLQHFLVVELIDGESLLVKSGQDADLRGANLRGAIGRPS